MQARTDLHLINKVDLKVAKLDEIIQTKEKEKKIEVL